MQVSVETPGGLERRMRVAIPSAEFEQAVDAQLAQIGRVAKINGFRPGKVPKKVLKQQYGLRARQDALSETLESNYPKALQESGLQPAGQPQIEFESIEEGQDMVFVAVFDVYPEIELKGVEGMDIKEADVSIGDEDVEKVLQGILEQGREFVDKDGPAADGDRVKVDYKGTVDGEAFAGGEGSDVEVVLGAGRFLKDLEDGIIEMSVGESKNIEVAFPEDYHSEEMQGKQAIFAVDLKEVAGSQLPEIDEEFLKRYGIEEGGEEALRAKLKESVEKEAEQAKTRYLKKQVMENVLAANEIEVPKGLVSQEIERMRQDASQRFGGQANMSHEDMHKLLPDEIFEEQAKKRTALGLLIGELIKSQEVKLDEEKVEAKMQEIAGDFEDSESAMAYYRNDPNFLQSLRAMVLEDQVVQLVLDKANKSTESLSFEELSQKAADS